MLAVLSAAAALALTRGAAQPPQPPPSAGAAPAATPAPRPPPPAARPAARPPRPRVADRPARPRGRRRQRRGADAVRPRTSRSAASLQQMKAQKVTPPPGDVLDKQLLERLITERVLMQYAKETGVRVDDMQVERTIQRDRAGQQAVAGGRSGRRWSAKASPTPSIARRSATRSSCSGCATARSTASISVSDAEVDNFLATVAAQTGGETEYRLAHILVIVPEQASPEQIDAKRRRAEDALKQIGAAPISPGRGRILGRAGCAQGRRPRLARAGAAADGVRRARAQHEARRRVGRAALVDRLSHRQAAGDRAAGTSRRSSSRRTRGTS